MDSDSWISARLSTSSRRYQSRSGLCYLSMLTLRTFFFCLNFPSIPFLHLFVSREIAGKLMRTLVMFIIKWSERNLYWCRSSVPWWAWRCSWRWGFQGGVSLSFLWRGLRCRWALLSHWWGASFRSQAWGIHVISFPIWSILVSLTRIYVMLLWRHVFRYVCSYGL